MGGMLLPDLGFDEAGFRQEFLAVLEKGAANMMRDASDTNAFTSAYENMDIELATLVKAHNPPESAVRLMRQHTKRVVESIVMSCDVDLASLHMEDVRRTCVHILSGIKGGNLLRLDRAYDDSVELFVKNGSFTYGEARELIAELSLLESRNFKDLLDKVGRSKNPGYLKFLQLVEEQGGERAKQVAQRAKENLLSTQSKPPAKLLRLPKRIGPQPLRRIRQ
jgi:hypothetical protein